MRPVAAVLCVLVMLAGASSSAAAAPSKGRPTGVCGLLTSPEVQRILGQRVTAPKRQRSRVNGPFNRCAWPAKKTGTGGVPDVPLELVLEVESSPTLVSSYNQAKAAAPAGAVVTGIGDDAFISDPAFPVNLHVLVGQRVLDVTIDNVSFSKDHTKLRVQLELAAKLAVARLGTVPS